MDKTCQKKCHYNYNKLLGKIKECYGTQDNFARDLGIGRVSLSQRLNNRLEFTQNEINLSCRLLKIPDYEIPTYFFRLIDEEDVEGEMKE